MTAIKATTATAAARLVLLLGFSQLPSTTLAFVPSSPSLLQHIPNTNALCARANDPLPQHHYQPSPLHILSSPLESLSYQNGRIEVNSNHLVHASPLFGSKSQNVGFRKNKSAASLRLAARVAHLTHFQRRANLVFRRWMRRITIGFMFVMMTWSLASGAAFARTGGRSGGSFKRAPMRPSYSRPAPPRSSYSRPPSRSYNNHHYRPSPGRVIMRPPTRLYYRNYRPPTVVVAPGLTTGPQFQPYGPTVRRRGISLTEVALVTGTGLFIASKVSNQLQQDRGQTNSALGPGFTMAKLTVSLNVPDRDDPNSILKTLQTISSTARTSTRAGVQQLISSVALELLRQDSAIRSAESKSNHYKIESDVERDFLQQSIQERSKFDRELEYKDGSPASSNMQKEGDSRATEAVVTILMAIEGDSTQLPAIQKRTDVLAALRKLAVDSQVDDCLLSGEVTWSPELRSETLTLTDIYADYPSLFPV